VSGFFTSCQYNLEFRLFRNGCHQHFKEKKNVSLRVDGSRAFDNPPTRGLDVFHGAKVLPEARRGDAASGMRPLDARTQARARDRQPQPENPVNPTDRFNAILERLKRQGHRMTPQRMAIVRAVLTHAGHPTVEQIHKQMLPDYPTTSLATVYKTISLLKAEGELLELGFGEHGSRYDGLRPRPHPHMICTRCGEILDLDMDSLEAVVAGFAAKTGYAVNSHRFDVFGLCPACRKG